LRGGLSLNVSLLILWEFKVIGLCGPRIPTTLLARLSGSQSLLPALLVSLEDSASLSSPGFLVKYQNRHPQDIMKTRLPLLFTRPKKKKSKRNRKKLPTKCLQRHTSALRNDFHELIFL